MQVTAYDMASNVIPVTSRYTEPATTTFQGSYVELPVMRDAITKIDVDIAPIISVNSYAALSEIEIYVGGKEVFSRFAMLYYLYVVILLLYLKATRNSPCRLWWIL